VERAIEKAESRKQKAEMICAEISAFFFLVSDFKERAGTSRRRAEMMSGTISAFCFLLSDFKS
jgi:hypothetical protein